MMGLASAWNRRRAWTRTLALALVTVGTSGCASLFERGLDKSVEEIGIRLVDAAQARFNVGSMRVWVYEIHETGPEPVVAVARYGVQPHHGGDEIGVALEHEFTIALSNHLYLVEAEFYTPLLGRTSGATQGDLAAARGATHLLVGDYQRKGSELLVSVRLVDVESRLIVAAASGVVPLAELGDFLDDVDEDPALGLLDRYPQHH